MSCVVELVFVVGGAFCAVAGEAMNTKAASESIRIFIFVLLLEPAVPIRPQTAKAA